MKVEDCEDFGNDVDIIWKKKEDTPFFKIKVDSDDTKCVMIPVRPKEEGSYIFASA